MYNKIAHCIIAVTVLLFCFEGPAQAAGIKVVPTVQKVMPGETFGVDVVVENVPAEGLGAVQFRLNVNAPGSTVAAVSDIVEGRPGDVSVSSPLTIGPATSTRSGIGDFFRNAQGPHGILAMDNEVLQNGAGLYTLGHTNGATLPTGNGAVARFQIAAGSAVTAEKIVISLSDVALLEGNRVYSLDSNASATVDLKCYTQTPNLIGMARAAAEEALRSAKLALGTVYEIDNLSGAHALNAVLVQSSNPGTAALCETAVDLAINTAPYEAGNAVALDKAGDEGGAVLLAWQPSSSADTAGYRVYNASGVRLAEVANAASTGVELSGLAIGQASQLRITAYDTHGNESAGAVVVATALDDIAPRIAISGVADNAFYAADVQPIITVQDANLSSQTITLNNAPYAQYPITAEGTYHLKVSAIDSSGNSAAKEVMFTVDKTAPSISVSGLAKGAYYNTDVTPVITITDANLAATERLINGTPYSSGTVLTAENSYQLTIQATDKAGNSASDTYGFLIDKTKPTSSLSVGLPGFENSGTLYVGGVTPLILSGNDSGASPSGVEKLEYRFNAGQPWNTYQAQFTLAGSADGPISLDYRAADRAANMEDFHTLTVTLDGTSPVTTLSPGQPQYTDAGGTTYVTTGTVFTLSATDALSGVETTEYKLDGAAWSPAAPFSINAEGSHSILYRSRDNLGNQEGDKSLNPVVDNTAPVTVITTGEPKYIAQEGKLFTTSGTIFTLAATDALSGVAATEYRIDGGAWMTYALFQITVEGTHTIDYRSRDAVANQEEFKTLIVTVDAAPPVTSIATGDPKHTAADGKLYVAGGTTFTLIATDALSGVAAAEYRIDGGVWTTYAPFQITAEGTHVIDYSSRDNVGNTEAFKTMTVIVDNTPPVSTAAVGTPQYQTDGKMYVSGDTGISMAAADVLSGVRKIEYSIDGGGWNDYAAAFTLTSLAEGMHKIRHRALDNLGNTEEPGEIVVMLDLTPPQTTVTASDPLADGVVNVVSPLTFFTLNAADAMSGVRSIVYRIGSGPWQEYTGSFSLAGQNAGQYSIAFRATDNVLNQETEKTISVRLITMAMEKKVGADSVVLVGIESDKSDFIQKQIDKERLRSLLASLNMQFALSETMDDFTAALRSGRYNTYILIDVKEPLVNEEIREAVYSGDSLIYIKTRPNADPFLDDLFGVKFSGKSTSDNLAVNLQSSPISAEGVLQSAGKSVVSTITTTMVQVIGTVTDKKDVHPAIIFNEYDKGKVLLYTFDLLSAPNQQLASALLVESLNFVRPTARAPRALGSIPLRITLTNSSEPVDAKVGEAFPSTATADSVVPNVTPVDNSLIWRESLVADEKARFGYYLNLPDMAGDFLTKTELTYGNNGLFRPYARYEHVLTVPYSSDELLQKIISDLRSLTVITAADRDLVAKAVDYMLLVNVNAKNRNEAEDNLKTIVNAIDEVRKLTVDGSAIRSGLDELLKIWERKWYELSEQ